MYGWKKNLPKVPNLYRNYTGGKNPLKNPPVIREFHVVVEKTIRIALEVLKQKHAFVKELNKKIKESHSISRV